MKRTRPRTQKQCSDCSLDGKAPREVVTFKSANPDVVRLQELKAKLVSARGYQEGRILRRLGSARILDGVALLLKGSASEVIRTRLPGDPFDRQTAISKRR